MSTDKGRKYLQARAADDGRVTAVLRDIGTYDIRGDMVLRDQAIRNLDDIAFRRIDGVPAYRKVDAIMVGREIARQNPDPPAVLYRCNECGAGVGLHRTHPDGRRCHLHPNAGVSPDEATSDDLRARQVAR